MARIACLWVPALPVAALLRIEPDLRDRPVAITAGRAPRSLVEAVSAAAFEAGVRTGMTATQARAVCPTVAVRPTSALAIAAAAEALADVATTVTPRVEVDADGTVFLDCAGTAALCASETELATILTARAERQGLTAHVGIGRSKLVARIAARECDGVRIVASAETRRFLASLPIALLTPDATTATTLQSWGITRIGQLADLPGGAVAHRLGAPGAALVRGARGEGDELLSCRATPVTFDEAVELDYAVVQIEALLFVLRRLLERMVGRFALHGLVCERCELTLDLDGGGEDLRAIVPAAPTAESKVLLTLIRTAIEQRPPAQGIVAVAVRGIATRLRPTQLDFFQPSGPAPAALAATIARLAALCGPDRVGAPVRPTSHRPEAFTISTFPGPAPAADEDPPHDGPPPGVASGAATAVGARQLLAPADGDDPPHARTIVATNGTAATVTTRIALRAFRPPRPLEIFHNRGRLDYVRGPGLGGRVVHLAGPWRLRGEWWTADPYAREYYDVELSDGGVYRIYHDVRRERWVADGAYD